MGQILISSYPRKLLVWILDKEVSTVYIWLSKYDNIFNFYFLSLLLPVPTFFRGFNCIYEFSNMTIYFPFLFFFLSFLFFSLFQQFYSFSLNICWQDLYILYHKKYLLYMYFFYEKCFNYSKKNLKLHTNYLKFKHIIQIQHWLFQKLSSTGTCFGYI